MTYDTRADLPELFNRMVPLFVAKLRSLPKAGYTEDEWWEVVVGTCIADTSIALDHPDYIDRWGNSLRDER